MTTLKQFLIDYEPKARSMANKYYRYHEMHPDISMDDIRQAARLALAEAYNRYKSGELGIAEYAEKYWMSVKMRDVKKMATDTVEIPEWLPYDYEEKPVEKIELNDALTLLSAQDRNMLQDHFGFYDRELNWEELGERYQMPEDEAREHIHATIGLLRAHWGVELTQVMDTNPVHHNNSLACRNGHMLTGGNLRVQYNEANQQCRACTNTRSWLSAHQPPAGPKRIEFREKNFLPKSNELYDRYITE